MYICEECNREIKVKYGYNMNKILCQTCYTYYKNGGKIHELPQKGEIKYDDRGYPICHICGKAYKKLLAHVWQVHNITEKEYKKQFGLDLHNGISCQDTKEKLRKAVEKHYDKVVKENLIIKGQKTRFKVNHKGRTKDKVSLQTLKRLKQSNFIKKRID